jgi:hypothetical protein
MRCDSTGIWPCNVPSKHADCVEWCTASRACQAHSLPAPTILGREPLRAPFSVSAGSYRTWARSERVMLSIGMLAGDQQKRRCLWLSELPS